jgi:hypothetical protein
MTRLKSVTEGHNKFCGPAVLSIVTGRSTDECAYAISKVSGQYKVEGVTLRDLIKAADKLGFICTETPFGGHTMYSALTSIANKDGIYIVMLTKHYVCIEVASATIYFCDNHTKEPMPAASSARLMQGVVGIYRVTAKPEPPKPELLPEKITETTVTYHKCLYCGSVSSVGREFLKHYDDCKYQIALEANK